MREIRILAGGSGRHSGNRRDRLLQPLMKPDIRACRVTRLWQNDLSEKQMVGAESGVDPVEPGQRANEEARPDDQQRGERDLKSRYRFAEPSPPPRDGSSALL